MGGTGSRISLGLAVVLAVLGVTNGVANADTSIKSSATCCTFEAGPFVQPLGGKAIFDNTLSISPHDVVAKENGPDGNPLFASEAILGGQTAPIDGTEYLATGSYGFYCSIHGASMSGVLTVDGSQGTVVPRPSVKVSFVSTKLKQVKKSGIKVKLKGVTASRNVTVTATKGKVELGSKEGLSLSAGQTKTVTIPLSKAGKSALSKGKSAQIKIGAAVPFGKPASATRKVK